MKIIVGIFCLFTISLCFQNCSKKDDPGTNATLPQIAILNAEASEGSPLLFIVGMDTTSKEDVSFYYEVVNVTTTSDDYTAPTGKTLVTITAGASAAVITISAKTDASTEPAETFKVVLSGAKNCKIAVSEATGTIDDVPPAQASPYYLTAKINGVTWSAYNSGFFGAELIGSGIAAYGTDGDSQIAVIFYDFPTGVKTYAMENGFPSTDATVGANYTPHFFSTSGLGVTYFSEPTNGEFKITAFDGTAKTITGTFKFTGNDGNGNLVQITDGTFFIPYED